MFRTDEVRAVRDGSKVTFGEQRGWFRLLLRWHRVEAFGEEEESSCLLQILQTSCNKETWSPSAGFSVTLIY